MWFAGNMHALSPMAGYMYAISGFGLMQGEMLADNLVRQLNVTFIKNGDAKIVPASYMLTSFGQVRLRIPAYMQDTGSVVAISLDQFMEHGIIHSIVFQSGKDSLRTLYSRDVKQIPASAVRCLQTSYDGHRFQATGPDAYLLVDIPESQETVSLLSLTVSPLASPMVEVTTSAPHSTAA
jgi:hypothetical protein